MTNKEIEKGLKDYEDFYSRMYAHVYDKLSGLNSYEIKAVGGERIFYGKEKVKIYTIYEINKKINELKGV